jgi:hypothetical protein
MIDEGSRKPLDKAVGLFLTLGPREQILSGAKRNKIRKPRESTIIIFCFRFDNFRGACCKCVCVEKINHSAFCCTFLTKLASFTTGI